MSLYALMMTTKPAIAGAATAMAASLTLGLASGLPLWRAARIRARASEAGVFGILGRPRRRGVGAKGEAFGEARAESWAPLRMPMGPYYRRMPPRGGPLGSAGNGRVE